MRRSASLSGASSEQTERSGADADSRGIHTCRNSASWLISALSIAALTALQAPGPFPTLAPGLYCPTLHPMFQSKHWSNISEWHCDVHKHSDAAFVPSFPPRLQTNNRLYQFYGSLSIIYASKWFSVPFLQIPPVMPLWIMKRKVFLKSFVSVTRALKILWDNVSLVLGNIMTIF